jgi:hypothetical protein
VCEVQRQWGLEFATEPATGLTIARIRDRIETGGTVHDVHKHTKIFFEGMVTSPINFNMLRTSILCIIHHLYGKSYFAFNKMAHHHATNGMSDATSMDRTKSIPHAHLFEPLPFDFYFSGSLKNLIYRRKSQTLETVTGRNWKVVCAAILADN